VILQAPSRNLKIVGFGYEWIINIGIWWLNRSEKVEWMAAKLCFRCKNVPCKWQNVEFELRNNHLKISMRVADCAKCWIPRTLRYSNVIKALVPFQVGAKDVAKLALPNYPERHLGHLFGGRQRWLERGPPVLPWWPKWWGVLHGPSSNAAQGSRLTLTLCWNRYCLSMIQIFSIAEWFSLPLSRSTIFCHRLGQ